jgi:hypothetical protein
MLDISWFTCVQTFFLQAVPPAITYVDRTEGHQIFDILRLTSDSHHTQEFPYAEHYGLVTEHLRILTVQEEGDAGGGTETGKKGAQIADNAPKMGNGVEEDEEWSEGEDEDEEQAEEETGMTVA